MPFKDPEAQRAYQREWVAKRRAAYFADKSCVRCGAVDDLQLDHIDPKTKDARLKTRHTNTIWAWSAANRAIEIAKCQVLCKPCHWAKTIVDLEYYQHGRPSTYNRGCKCPECTRANRDKMRRQRAK